MKILLLLFMSLMTDGHPSCSSESLAVYKLVLETLWSEKMFPKQYPQWRPPPQWSKTIGYTHNGSISLFETGSAVSDGVRMFVEKGDSNMLERESAGISFLDAVFAPSIQQGEGKTEALVFVDGNNTKISCMTAIVPSPDWFIGLDGVDLCQDGQWLDNIRLEVSPMDAGTDNGLTFTSPNWATDPRGEVFAITNTFPPHPAASFNYPHLQKLPTIAVYTMQKQRVYSLIETVPRKPIEKKTDAVRYRYDVNTSDSNVEEIDFVPVNTTPINKTKHNSKTKSDTHKSGKTNSQIISQYLNFDPVAKKTANATIKLTKLPDKLDFVTIMGNDNNGKRGKKYAEILSNEIPELEFYNSGKFDFATYKHADNSLLEFIPVRMVTKTKKLMMSRKNKDKKTVHDIDNSLKTKILVTNEGLKRRHMQRIKKKTKGFRSSSNRRHHASTGLQNLLKKNHKVYNMSDTHGSIMSGNLASLGKRQLYRQILQSYKSERGNKKLRKRKRRYRKRKHAKRKSAHNCCVSAWSSWGSCSVSCGIGESVRQRTVEQHTRHGGLACPGLKEVKWCGSARNCNKGYFGW